MMETNAEFVVPQSLSISGTQGLTLTDREFSTIAALPAAVKLRKF